MDAERRVVWWRGPVPHRSRRRSCYARRSDNDPLQVITSRRFGLKRLIYNRIRKFSLFLPSFCFILLLILFPLLSFYFWGKKTYIKKLTHSRFTVLLLLLILRHAGRPRVHVTVKFRQVHALDTCGRFRCVPLIVATRSGDMKRN